MQKTAITRIVKLVKKRLKDEDPIYVIGIGEGKFQSRIHRFLQSGQIVRLDNVTDLLGQGTDANSLILVTNDEDNRAAGKVPGKVESGHPGAVIQIVDTATDETHRLLKSEMDADAAAKAAAKPTPPKPPQAADLVAGATQLTPMQQLATRFLKEANAEGLMSSIALKRLVSEIDNLSATNAELTRQGWFEPWRQTPESKISGYTATDKLRELAGEVVIGEEPTDPYERAQFLVASESALLECKAKLEASLDEISTQLERVAKAKAWLARGSDF